METATNFASTLLQILAPALILFSPAAHAAPGDASTDFGKLLDDAWQFEIRENPLWATEVGDHRYDDQLPKISLDDESRRASARRDFLNRLLKIDRDSLPAADRVSHDILSRQLREQLAEYEFKAYLMPISDRYGFHIEFPELARNTPLATVEDFDNFTARLRGFDKFAAGYIELMREGLKEDMTVPGAVMGRFAEPLDAQIVDDPDRSLLYAPFRDLPATIPAADRERLQVAAKDAISESVVPGYQRFLEFMRDEYVPRCRSSIAAAALPNGRNYYKFCIGKFTTLDNLTPHEIHELGKSQVAAIRREMQDIIDEVGFQGDFQAFTKSLRDNPKYFAKTPEELEKEAAIILKRMDGELPKLFGRLPRSPYGLRRIPEFIAPQATAAYYLPSSGDGRRAGFFYLNTTSLASRPLYMLEALACHEAVPGHHLQIALQQEIESLPNFRRYGQSTAFVEGWALYAERLGLETGFYTDPYCNFGRLSMEMWRACRLVVDTGIHYFGWSRNRAIDFMAENSAMPLHDIRAEVDRYIGWPGQALAYKIGELKIRELRAEAEQRLKDNFDIRDFHDTILASGSVPLNVLESNVHNWIAEKAPPLTPVPSAN